MNLQVLWFFMNKERYLGSHNLRTALCQKVAGTGFGNEVTPGANTGVGDQGNMGRAFQHLVEMGIIIVLLFSCYDCWIWRYMSFRKGLKIFSGTVLLPLSLICPRNYIRCLFILSYVSILIFFWLVFDLLFNLSIEF